MADEIIKRDSNRVTVSGGVLNDSSTDVTQFRIDPTTKRLLVSGVALDKATDDILVYFNTAKDASGTSYIPIVDADGHLQIDVLSGGGGTQYAIDTALGATPTGTLAIALRDDALSALTPIEGDAVGLRVDANGALWVIPSGTVTVDGSAVTQPVSGTFWQATQPVSATDLDIRDLTATDVVTANLSAVDNAVLDTIDAVLDTINAKLVTGTVIGDVNLGATDNAVLDDIAAKVATVTGIGHGVKVVTTAGTDVVLAGSTACKKVDIQSQTDNTGLIAVGSSGVDATEVTGTGIILYAGDVYSLEIDNLADIYIDSTVNGEGVRYTYYT